MAKTLDLTFAEFKLCVMPAFASKFSPRDTGFIYSDAYNTFGDQMLAEYDYTPEREQFLIRESKLFLKAKLSYSESHNTSTDFLEKLVNKIAAHLSYYVMNKYPIPESGKSKNKLRIRVQAKLKQVLFDENPYILNLKKKQEQNRAFRQKTKSERRQIIQEKQRRDAADAYRYSRQIKDVFQDTIQSTLIRKR